MSEQRHKDLLIPLLTVVGDAAAIEAAFLFSFWVRFHSPLTSILPVELGVPSLNAYIYGSFALIPPVAVPVSFAAHVRLPEKLLFLR